MLRQLKSDLQQERPRTCGRMADALRGFRGVESDRIAGGGLAPVLSRVTCIVVVCLWIAVSSRAASACTIPVFRYALDRWEPDAFRLVVPRAWATDREMSKLLVPLRGNAVANVRVEESDDTAVDRARLFFPHADSPLWQGDIDALVLMRLLDSPARRALRERLLAGDSVVWVVVTTDADAAAVDRIASRLRFLEQVGELPEQNPDDPDSQLGPGPPLHLKFSVLRVSLADPGERIFAEMLAGPEHPEFVPRGVSFAAAVFGRGRVLGAWPLAELDDRALEDASLFLTGRCSCRIKNGNPGWDILLQVDWEAALEAGGMIDGGGPIGGDHTAPVGPGRGPVEAFTVEPAGSAGGEARGGLWRPQLGGIGLAILAGLAGWRLWRGH